MENELYRLLKLLFDADYIELKTPGQLEKTIPDMLSDNYEDRFKAEHRQLLIRYQSLCKYIMDCERDICVHKTDIALLKEQRACMHSYLCILVKRAGVEGIDLVG